MKRKTIVRIRPLALAVALACAPAWANPVAPSVVNGTVAMTGIGTANLQITNSPGAIINWQSFSVAAKELTHFQQQGANSAVLNRVTGVDPSSILGTLSSNGRVFLINPNGIVFGNGSVVDVAGLIASTRDISNSAFLTGNWSYEFSGTSSNAILVENGALISTAKRGDGGQVWLFAKDIGIDAGARIEAPAGQVVLAAGTRVRAYDSGLGGTAFDIDMDGSNTIQNLGTIAAARGAVGLFADNIAQGGAIDVHGANGTAGTVQMTARNTLTFRAGASISADGQDATAGGSVSLTAGNRLIVEKNVSVTADGGPDGGNGGDIEFRAPDIHVADPEWRSSIHAAARATGAADGNVNFSRTDTGAVPSVNATVSLADDPSRIFLSTVVLADGSMASVWIRKVQVSDPVYLGSGFWIPATYSYTLMGQRRDAHGTPVSDPFVIAENGGQPSIAPLAAGGFVIVWKGTATLSDGTQAHGSILGRVYGATGNAVGDVFTAYAGIPDAGINDPTVHGLSNGGFAITWVGSQQSVEPVAGYYPSKTTLWVTRYNPTTGIVGPEFKVAEGSLVVPTPNSIDTVAPAEAGGSIRMIWGGDPISRRTAFATPDGGLWLTWFESSTPTVAFSNIWGVKVAADGTVGTPVRFDTSFLNGGYYGNTPLAVTQLSNGNLAMAYYQQQDGAGHQVDRMLVQRFDTSGATIGSATLVSDNMLGTTWPVGMQIQPTANNGYVVSWQEAGAPLQKFSARSFSATDQAGPLLHFGDVPYGTTTDLALSNTGALALLANGDTNGKMTSFTSSVGASVGTVSWTSAMGGGPLGRGQMNFGTATQAPHCTGCGTDSGKKDEPAHEETGEGGACPTQDTPQSGSGAPANPAARTAINEAERIAVSSLAVGNRTLPPNLPNTSAPVAAERNVAASGEPAALFASANLRTETVRDEAGRIVGIQLVAGTGPALADVLAAPAPSATQVLPITSVTGTSLNAQKAEAAAEKKRQDEAARAETTRRLIEEDARQTKEQSDQLLVKYFGTADREEVNRIRQDLASRPAVKLIAEQGTSAPSEAAPANSWQTMVQDTMQNLVQVGAAIVSGAGYVAQGAAQLVSAAAQAGGQALSNAGTGVANAAANVGNTVADVSRSVGAGVVAMGGGNVVAAGGANVVAMGGGNVVAAGGANVVAMGGGNLQNSSGAGVVAMGGGNVVAAGGANVVAMGGGNVVAMGGGNLKSNSGAGVVAMGGGNVVAMGGGNVVAMGGGNVVAMGGGNVVAMGGMN